MLLFNVSTHNVLLLGLLLLQSEHGHQGVALSWQRPKVCNAQLGRNVCMTVLNSVTADAGEAELKRANHRTVLSLSLTSAPSKQTHTGSKMS